MGAGGLRSGPCRRGRRRTGCGRSRHAVAHHRRGSLVERDLWGKMKPMATPSRNAPDTTADSGAPPRRAWVRPVLVEYGHLAKLTRGTSGTLTEFTTKKPPVMCL